MKKYCFFIILLFSFLNVSSQIQQYRDSLFLSDIDDMPCDFVKNDLIEYVIVDSLVVESEALTVILRNIAQETSVWHAGVLERVRQGDVIYFEITAMRVEEIIMKLKKNNKLDHITGFVTLDNFTFIVCDFTGENIKSGIDNLFSQSIKKKKFRKSISSVMEEDNRFFFFLENPMYLYKFSNEEFELIKKIWVQ